MQTDVRSWPRLLAAIVCAGATGLFSPAGLAHNGVEHKAPTVDEYQRSQHTYAVPDVTLTDAQAQPVRLRELLAANEPVMLNFIFTSCGTICPVMSKVFSDVPAALGGAGKKLRMVSISIDPENDNPARLQSYARQFGANARWSFLTGRLQDVKAVQVAFDNYRGDKMNHEPLTLLRKAPDQAWVRIDGFASPEALAREYQKTVKQ
jgi:protein SCO1